MKNKIDIVITMGGLGSRFKEAGYNIPKYMIEANGKTLFEWSLISLEGYKEVADKFIFIVKKYEQLNIEEFISEKCKILDINNYTIIIIDYLTDGQASTAMLAKKYWTSINGLLIYNIDTYVEAGAMNYRELKGDGFIPCFEGEGDHWSFVKINNEGKATEIKEKQRISNYCTLGAYYFKTCELYEKLYTEYYGVERRLVNNEKYVAPLYDYLISKGGNIYISNIPKSKVHVLGTPEELKDFVEKYDG